ncbi:unnamed protein product [Meganyctiphanes norvegica]|uniref:NADH dehydrogenase [ubiquinone] 1 alpha subcomplex subunit 11 n=1 Tax=Meganyctiphanes norvegica TaxID=48144 RepID=A0AAV2RNM0_MEGNR
MGYSDAPDGEQCFQKMLICGKNAGLVGVIASTYDLLMVTKPQGYVPAIGCYIRGTIPLAAAGLTFATVSCMATNLRHKDDKFNYFLGGASAGGIIGVAKKSFRLGIPVAFLLGISAIIFKDSLDSKWELLPKIDHQMGTFDTIKNDYTRT